MTGWTRDRRRRMEDGFYEFLDLCYINSKDKGRICLGSNLYYGQKLFFTTVFDALENDIHDIYCLKSRQLGISTSSRALEVFFNGLYSGVKGALVFDTDQNKQEARADIITMINDLPRALKFPRVVSDNRHAVTLENGSKILFLSAGTSKKKSSGTLGRSVGLSFSHGSELCSWDNDEGLEAYRNSLSDENPDRLYIWESTARGYNIWNEMWVEARRDTAHCSCIFLGWWSKDSQKVSQDTADFIRYGEQAPTEKEIKKIYEVKKTYGVEISPEQLAWVRRKMDPGAQKELLEGTIEYEGDALRIQEQPWTEDEAFQVTGSAFFQAELLNEQVRDNVSRNFKPYVFSRGPVEFTDLKIFPATNPRALQLKVWEEPVVNGTYVISADPAYGASEDNDRSCIQVLRAYADGLDQCAEFTDSLVGTRPFAWEILALCGWYADQGSEIYLIVELNGPGSAVWDEIVYMRHHIASGYQPREIEEMGLKNIFRNVRNYIYTRPDSLAAGKAIMWKTTSGEGMSGKVRLMERFRDFTHSGLLRVRSMEAIEEMRWVSRDGDSIEARGRKKDDRVIALALGVRCWEERCRRFLATQKRTRAAEAARLQKTIVDQSALFTQHQLENMFAYKRSARRASAREVTRAAWRYR